jgi:hypothetical protein
MRVPRLVNLNLSQRLQTWIPIVLMQQQLINLEAGGPSPVDPVIGLVTRFSQDAIVWQLGVPAAGDAG